MKKIFNIIIITFFLTNHSFAKTFYCKSKEWKQYMVINVNFTLNIVQHPTFRNGEKYIAKISNNEIFFNVDGEHWTIKRKSGNFLRKNFEMDIYQNGKCTIKKPKTKKKSDL